MELTTCMHGTVGPNTASSDTLVQTDLVFSIFLWLRTQHQSPNYDYKTFFFVNDQPLTKYEGEGPKIHTIIVSVLWIHNGVRITT